MWLVPRVQCFASLFHRPAAFRFAARLLNALKFRQRDVFLRSYVDESSRSTFLSDVFQPVEQPMKSRQRKFQEAVSEAISLQHLTEHANGCHFESLKEIAEKAATLNLLDYDPYTVGKLLSTLGSRLHTLGRETMPDYCFPLQSAAVKFIAEVSGDISRLDALILARGGAVFNLGHSGMDALLLRLEQLCVGSVSSLAQDELGLLADVLGHLCLHEARRYQAPTKLVDEVVLAVNEGLETIQPDVLVNVIYRLSVIKPTAVDDRLLEELDKRLPPILNDLTGGHLKRIARLFITRRYHAKQIKLFPRLCSLLPVVSPITSLALCRLLYYCVYIENADIDQSFLNELDLQLKPQLKYWPIKALSELSRALVGLKGRAEALVSDCASHALAKDDLFSNENRKYGLEVFRDIVTLHVSGEIPSKFFSVIQNSVENFTTVDTVHLVGALLKIEDWRSMKAYAHFIHLAVQGPCAAVDLNDNLAIKFARALIALRICHAPYVLALVTYVQQQFLRISSDLPNLVFLVANLVARCRCSCDRFMQLVAKHLDKTSQECVDVSARTICLSWFCASYGIYPQEALRAVFAAPLHKLKELSTDEHVPLNLLQLHWLLQSDESVKGLTGLPSDTFLFVQDEVARKLLKFEKKPDWLLKSFDSKCISILTKESVPVSLALLYRLPTATHFGQWLSWTDVCLDPTNLYPDVLHHRGLVAVAVRFVNDSQFASDDEEKPLAVEHMQKKLLNRSGWWVLNLKLGTMAKQTHHLEYLQEMLKGAKSMMKLRAKRNTLRNKRGPNHGDRRRTQTLKYRKTSWQKF